MNTSEKIVYVGEKQVGLNSLNLSDTLTQSELWYVFMMRTVPLKPLWVKSLVEGLNGGKLSLLGFESIT